MVSHGARWDWLEIVGSGRSWFKSLYMKICGCWGMELHADDCKWLQVAVQACRSL